jgi:hypothetical protein
MIAGNNSIVILQISSIPCVIRLQNINNLVCSGKILICTVQTTTLQTILDEEKNKTM